MPLVKIKIKKIRKNTTNIFAGLKFPVSKTLFFSLSAL
jgi:hypothetical protein